MRALVCPQDVARMAVAMQADAFCFTSRAASLHQLQRLLGHCLPRIQEIRRHERALQQVRARVMAEVARSQRLAVDELLRCAYGVNASKKATDPFQGLEVAELGCASAAARIDRDAKAA